MRRKSQGFSLLETAVAIGLAAFALVSLVALLPLGIESNRISSEETVAAGILSVLEADLKNTHPSLNSGNSLNFGIPLPYKIGGTAGGGLVFNDALAAEYTIRVSESQRPALETDAARYQVTILYNTLAAGSLEPMQARLIVNWPPVKSAGNLAHAITDTALVSGYVEAWITFPHP